MKTKLVLWISALLLLIGGVGCEKDEDKILSELIGTWKLVGFGNTANKTLREAEPKECEKCYIITFLSDRTITGHTSTNEIGGEYRIKGRNLNFLRLGGTKVGEYPDGYIYVEAIEKVHRFEIVSKQLKLYYDDTYYLLFKKK